MNDVIAAPGRIAVGTGFDRSVAAAERDAAERQLEQLAKNTEASGGSGIADSNTLLDPGAVGLRFFEWFGPSYVLWTEKHVGGIFEAYDEFRGIALEKFRSDARGFGRIGAHLDEATTDLDRDVRAARAAWTGGAAEIAEEHSRVLLSGGRAVTDGVSTASSLVAEGIRLVESQVLERARAVLGLWTDHIAGMNPHHVELVVLAAKGRLKEEHLPLLESVPLYEPHRSYLAGSRIDTGQKLTIYGHLASQWLTGTFVPAFDAHKSSFDSICSATKNAVGEGWTGIVDGITALDANPFDGTPGHEGGTPSPNTGIDAPGDGTVTVSEPDADGMAWVTVRDDDGSIRSYRVDLSSGTATLTDNGRPITVTRDADGTLAITAGEPAGKEIVDGGPAGTEPNAAASITPAAAPSASPATTPLPVAPMVASLGGGGTRGAGTSPNSGQPSQHTSQTPLDGGILVGAQEPVPPLPAATSTTTTAATTHGGGAGMPFMPMMPMSGAGGDQDRERKRGAPDPGDSPFAEDLDSYRRVEEILDPDTGQ
ncbi:hypothetical protein EV193_106356 [Herbihabitans rhizosphaerae]|uniref:Uncharacterized protein n=1 Tax=Herbihabitans rhizosphaerae TaxID=1872711 RepID=A0A4Q7KKG6_9PSEU|nr:hypothetical protein [Herbihabitans rhizosphaerae]RZS37118.1 hypothetical protein EV193_106356 [Herbihabitans rhizosphaerae]